MKKLMSSNKPIGQSIDAHAHLNNTGLQTLLERMDEMGIEKTVVVAGGLIDPYELSHRIIYGLKSQDIDVIKANDYVIEVSLQYPSLLPFMFINPYQPITTNILEQMKKCFGLKLAPVVHGVGFLDPRVKEYVSLAMHYEMPFYSHCCRDGCCSVEAFTKLAQSFPMVTFILGHGGRSNLDLCAIDCIQSRDNIYFETSGSYDYVIYEAVRKLGSERVIFGSEFPLQHQRVELIKISGILLPTDYHKVCYSNICRLLGEGRENRFEKSKVFNREQYELFGQ